MKNGGENKVRKNNRNSIASMEKLPQFTTMNVIDGQAGLVIYSSLIFYSLTIDNILNIIVLLILAGVTISSLTGQNGILGNASKAKIKNEEAQVKEQISLAYSATVMGDWTGETGTFKDRFKSELEGYLGTGNVTFETDGNGYVITVEGKGTYTVDENGKIEKIEKIANLPAEWAVASSTNNGNEWYAYTDISSATNTTVSVNIPNLVGKMKAIKYTGTTTGSKWANAMTSDGSMFVWIPRYAYKITYTAENSREAGTIDVAFINEKNEFLNPTKDTGTITADPTEDGAGTTKWLVHPAFTTNAANGGGWSKELTGLWVGKFEATGTKTKDADGNVTEATISVLPGKSALVEMKIKDQYKFAKTATFGETVTLNSHMAKNSEWGAMVYLAYSKYGRNGSDVTRQSSGLTTGGTSTVASIYSTNYGQSTTNNAYGVYGLRGGAKEYVASYVIYANNSNLKTYGGETSGDLYGTGTEPSTSTEYKTVYTASGTSESSSYNLLASTNKIRGDAVWETSTNYTGDTSWHDTGDNVHSYFPAAGLPFFKRGGGYDGPYVGLFYFDNSVGNSYSDYSFRPVLAP